MKNKPSTPAPKPADTPAPKIGPALLAFYDDCAYWANYARQKQAEQEAAK